MTDAHADIESQVEHAYAAADERMLGLLIKVTPSSKVVGDLDLALVGKGISADEFAWATGYTHRWHHQTHHITSVAQVESGDLLVELKRPGHEQERFRVVHSLRVAGPRRET